MSWLSDRTGIHIGSGPKKVNFAPPPEIANDPAKVAEFLDLQNKVNKTIGQANTINKATLIGTSALVGGGLLGVGPMAGGAATTAGAGAGTAGTAGAAGGDIATAAASGGGFLDKLKSLGKSAVTNGTDLLGRLNDATGGGSLLDKGLLAAAIADAAANRQRQQELQDKGLNYATSSYDARAPLRQRGLELIQDETAPDLGSIFVNPKNPYNKTVPRYQVSSKAPITSGGAS